MVALSQTGELEPVLQAAREGDPVAFRQLSDRYLAGLVAFAGRRNAEDPEEIANAALYDGFSNLYRFRSHTSSSFRAYLFRCAANRVNTEHRKVKPIYVPLSDDSLELRSVLEETDDIVASDEWFNKAIVALPVDQKAVIKERFGEGSTIAETARRLGKSADSIKNLQERALHRLRRDLLLAGAIVALIVLTAVVLSSRSADVVVESTPADDGTRSTPQVDPAADAVLRVVAPEGARSTSDSTVAPPGESTSAQTSIFSRSSVSDMPNSTSAAEANPEANSTAPDPTQPPLPDRSTNLGPAAPTGVEQQSDTSLVTAEPSPNTSAPTTEGDDESEQGGKPETDRGKSAEAPGKSSGGSGNSSDAPGKSAKSPKGPKADAS